MKAVHESEYAAEVTAGGTVVLQYLPHELFGHYFAEAT